MARDPERARTVPEEPDTGATLAAEGSVPRVQLPSAPPIPATVSRYREICSLGEGGMGEVKLFEDENIGREIAMKRIRDPEASGEVRDRFLSEARIQGQLEHPSVVPVYDLGARPDGSHFFTMKRVRGRTLESILLGLQVGESDEERSTLRRLLADFSQLCLALDFVHRHAVVHRDVKPANVMLGDFGEVYLLDWGLAKALDAKERIVSTLQPPRLGESGAKTSFGAVLGTPGYMAPEQADPAINDVDTRADIFALGAVLFEILAGEPLIRGDSTRQLLQRTLTGVESRVSLRAPGKQVPPELEALVVEATAQDRNDRTITARELSEGVERYLDGDRDVERRRARAAEIVAEAKVRAIRALEEGDLEARRESLRQLGQALAFDADNQNALRGLVELLTTPPNVTPPEVEEELAALERRQQQQAGRVGAAAFLLFNAFIPLIAWMGVHDWLPFVAFSLLSTAAGVTSYAVSRLPQASTPESVVVFFLGLAAGLSTSMLFGPFMLAPSVVAVITLIFSLNTPRNWRPWMVATGALVVAAPAIAEWLGVLPASVAFSDEGLLILPRYAAFPALPTLTMLLTANVAVVFIAGAAMLPIRAELDDAQRRMRMTAWQLRNLVPPDAEGADPSERP